MKQLLIIGARGWGREVFALTKFCRGYQTEFVVKGFLDDNTDALSGMNGYPPIIDSVENYIPQQEDVFICALGDNKWKKHYADIIVLKGGEFMNLIHKTAYVGQNTRLGFGCIVCHEASISCDVKVGNFVTFQRLADIGHDVRIGSYSTLGTKSFMGGGARLGENSTIQTGAIVLPHITIGNNCTVGAGSVVIRKVKDGHTVFGNPAKRVEY